MSCSKNSSAMLAGIACCIGVATGSSLKASGTNFDADDAIAFEQTNLDADLAAGAKFSTANLTNPWGLALAPGGAFWVNGNHSGTLSLIKGDGAVITTLVVSIPSPSGKISAPTGILANPTTGFFVPGSKLAAAFIVDTEDGTVAAWNPGVDATRAVIAVDNSQSGAVYKGLTFGAGVGGNYIYATNFSAGTVDVFDSNFAPVMPDGRFVDQHIAPGFAPFGIQNIDGDLWITYAKQDAQKMDDDAASGNGFVDVFDTDGHLLRRFAQHGALNSPWGLTRAPCGFGQFSGDILIGNQGDGLINAFDTHGNFVGALRRPDGKPVKIDRLWALAFGGGALSDPEQLFFTAGPNDENNGLFGVINATPRDKYRTAD